MLEAGKVGEQKDLCDFGKNQIVMGQSISKMASHGVNFDAKKPQI